MTRIVAFSAILLSSSLMTSCEAWSPPSGSGSVLASQSQESQWEMGDAWTGPYGGVPAFDKMELSALEPALKKAMAENLREVDVIAALTEPANFENTIVALERTGRELDRVLTYYGIWSSNMSSPEFREIEARLEPEISAFFAKITQNRDLFQRVEAVRKGNEFARLTPAEQRLANHVYLGFTRNGGTLEGEKAKRYAAINQELASLYSEFSNNILADEENYVLFLTDAQTGGLPDSYLGAAAAAASERDRPGTFAVTNTRSSVEPFLTYSTERDLREQVWRTFYSRGDNGDATDNNALITDILNLRDERVGLLGYDNYASWRLEDRMAKTPERAFGLMQQVWEASTSRVDEEVADMQHIADRSGDRITIQPWDNRYYAEKVRKDRYDLDSEEIKNYLQLDNLRLAMFDMAEQLFRFQFTPVAENAVPVFHPDVKVWEVTHVDTGEHVGLWYLDPFARAGKRSGAWASAYRAHETFDGKRTVLSSNNSNFIKPAPGEPVLVSWTDANTFFHEFGHALHYLSSTVEYPTQNAGVRDYTEFQSQLLERWLMTDRVIKTYLKHVDTGAPMPDALIQKIKDAATFNQGFATTEYLASALIDMKLHTVDPAGLDPDAFERQTLNDLGMPDEIVMRHRTPQFGHVFSGEGYAAGYYGYIWADVLTSDAAEAFANAPGGFYDREVGDRAVKYLFSAGNSMDPADAYRIFRGRDARIEALMRDRGFAD